MINLLPYQEKKNVDRLRRARAGTLLLWMATTLSLAAAALYVPTLQTINSRYRLMEGRISSLQKIGAVVSPVDVASLDVRTKILVSKFAAPNIVDPTAHALLVRSLAGSGIALAGFSEDTATPKTLSVAGSAQTRSALQAFVETLRANPLVKSVDSPISNLVKSSDGDFSLTVTFTS